MYCCLDELSVSIPPPQKNRFDKLDQILGQYLLVLSRLTSPPDSVFFLDPVSTIANKSTKKSKLNKSISKRLISSSIPLSDLSLNHYPLQKSLYLAQSLIPLAVVLPLQLPLVVD
jgi:hypothetical protein